MKTPTMKPKKAAVSIRPSMPMLITPERSQQRPARAPRVSGVALLIVTATIETAATVPNWAKPATARMATTATQIKATRCWRSQVMPGVRRRRQPARCGRSAAYRTVRSWLGAAPAGGERGLAGAGRRQRGGRAGGRASGSASARTTKIRISPWMRPMMSIGICDRNCMRVAPLASAPKSSADGMTPSGSPRPSRATAIG